MILLLQPQVGLTLADASGSYGQFGLWVRSSASADTARAALADLRGLLPSSCTAITGRVVYSADEQSPAPGSGDGTRRGVFVFETTDPLQFAVFNVPGLKPALVDLTAPYLVDLTAPAIAAFIAGLQAGPWCNPFGYSLTNCIAAMVELA